MKKALAIILTLLMLFGAVSCGAGSPTEEPAKPEQNEPVNDNQQKAPPDDETEVLSPDDIPAEPAAETTVGLKATEVDHFSRDTAEIVYIVTVWTSINASISAEFENLGEIMNYNYAVVDAENNSDLFLNYIEVYAVKGCNGFILDFYMDLAPRIAEYCSELGVNWIVAVNPCMDEDGNMLWPGVTFDAITAGRQMGDWLFENYKAYFGDIDPKEIGLMAMATTQMIDLYRRALGAEQSFKEHFPDTYDTNYFFADETGKAFSSEVAFDDCSAIISAHQEFKYWLIASQTDIHALGMARAVESLGRDDTSLVTCVGADAVIVEWDADYDGCLKAALHLPAILYAEPMICGLIAMLEGRATPETLWPEHIAEGQTYANLQLTYDIYTKENYKEGLASAADIVAGYRAELGL